MRRAEERRLEGAWRDARTELPASASSPELWLRARLDCAPRVAVERERERALLLSAPPPPPPPPPPPLLLLRLRALPPFFLRLSFFFLCFFLSLCLDLRDDEDDEEKPPALRFLDFVRTLAAGASLSLSLSTKRLMRRPVQLMLGRVDMKSESSSSSSSSSVSFLRPRLVL